MNQNSIKTLIAVMVMMAASCAAVMSFSDAMVDAEEQAYDIDMGKFYSLKTQLIWDGKDAESILYEFSDGTTSTEWNPLKTWDSPGTYYIKQTAYNSYNGGSETTTVYKVEIMGYPEIHFEVNGGSAVEDIEQTAFNVVASQPDDPTRDGYTFTGWFSDADCTQAFDWSQGLKKDTTLYAGWEKVDAPVDPTPGDDEDDKDGFHIELWMIILIVVIVIIVAAVYLLRR